MMMDSFRRLQRSESPRPGEGFKHGLGLKLCAVAVAVAVAPLCYTKSKIKLHPVGHKEVLVLVLDGTHPFG